VKLLASSALGYTTDPSLLAKTLEYSLSGEVRDQDVMYIFGSVGGNPNGRLLAWNFLKANWQRINKRFGDGSFLFVRFIEYSTRIVDETIAKDVEAFFTANPAPSATRTIQQSLESIRTNVRWLERDRKQVADYLHSNFS